MDLSADPESDSDIAARRPASLGADTGLFLLRIAAVGALFHYQLWEHLAAAWKHLWNREEWPLIEQFADLPLPQTDSIAPVFVLCLSLAAAGLVTGLFTRVAALGTMLLLVFAILSLVDFSPTLNPQTMVLYLAVAVCLFFAGAGRFSLDYLLVGRRGRKGKRRKMEEGKEW